VVEEDDQEEQLPGPDIPKHFVEQQVSNAMLQRADTATTRFVKGTYCHDKIRVSFYSDIIFLKY
jgi:hypothetical protein